LIALSEKHAKHLPNLAAQYSPKMVWQDIFPGHRRACQNHRKIEKCWKIKTGNFHPGIYSPGITFSGGGDKTITGRRGKRVAPAARLGVIPSHPVAGRALEAGLNSAGRFFFGGGSGSEYLRGLYGQRTDLDRP
jgi:hypothetical protein